MMHMPDGYTTAFPGGPLMPNTYTAITKQDGDWWIGWIEEVPGVNCQERTREDLLESLRVTLKEALGFNREEAVRAAAPDYTEESLTV
jgi:predicted RNase H-like HicB family nuclease